MCCRNHFLVNNYPQIINQPRANRGNRHNDVLSYHKEHVCASGDWLVNYLI